MTFFLIYVSTATQLFSADQLHLILDDARIQNAHQDVTGALLYHEGNFMQVLEGDETTVRDLYQRISDDPRHHGLEVLVEGETDERQFDDWSMAFRDFAATADDLAVGFSAFMLSREDTFGDRPTVAQRLLLSFRRSLVTHGG